MGADSLLLEVSSSLADLVFSFGSLVTGRLILCSLPVLLSFFHDHFTQVNCVLIDKLGIDFSFRTQFFLGLVVLTFTI